MKTNSAQLKNNFQNLQPEVGCDEAGRGCLAGPVFSAAVILPHDFYFPLLNDSKQLNEKQRLICRDYIEANAIDFAVAKCSEKEIDKLNILNASIAAMHKAISKLKTKPQFIIVDGNRFKSYHSIPHQTIIKGDGKYASIAAASVLAKTYRDEWMMKLHKQHPNYLWTVNKGYPTKAHREAIRKNGATSYHRKSFQLLPRPVQLKFYNH